MKPILTTILIIISFTSFCQSIYGHYEGALSREGAIQLISLDYATDRITYDIPEIGYHGVYAENVKWSNDTLNITIFYGDFFCLLNKETGDITGISKDPKSNTKLHLKRAKGVVKKFTEEEIVFQNGSISLSGVIFRPDTATQAIPYVILIHRSGWEDRNTPWYHSLATILASRGIGVLLYDKRGCGKSTGDFSTATFDDLANDAAAAYSFLRGKAGVNVSKIGFMGASQGGWITPLAANKVNDCGFAILIVGPSVSLYEQDMHRVAYTLRDEGYPKESIDSAKHYSDLYFKYVQSNADKDWKQLRAYANTITSRKWVGYLDLPETPKSEGIRWWRSNKYDPSESLRKINCPVLSIFGEKDVLVPPAENVNKMEAYLSQASVAHKIVVLPRCGHDMITIESQGDDSLNWPANFWRWKRQPQEFADSIVDWIQK